MTLPAMMQTVDVTSLPEYPVAADMRLDSHHFVSWEFRRWLNSQMRMKGTPECRALYFDLICVAHDQTPVGTLPRDMEVLAKLIHMDLAAFQRLCGLDYGPLYQWQPCLADGEVRLFHPMVLATVQDSISRKEHNRARTEAASRDKRLQRLRERLQPLGGDLAKSDAAVMFIDDWLVERCSGNRTLHWFQQAIEAWMTGHGRGARGDNYRQ